jgi:hypothetical protein
VLDPQKIVAEREAANEAMRARLKCCADSAV